MPPRRVQPEILDELPPDHPDAVASRNDLRRLNALMGNGRWILRSLARLDLAGDRIHVVEIGAGDGALGRAIASRFPMVRYTAIDRMPKPPGWPDELAWIVGDALEQTGAADGDVLVANLVLHHFSDEELASLGESLAGYRAVLASEPARHRTAHALARGARLLGLNRVTQHDIHVSIDAGFRGRELADALGLRPEIWDARSEAGLLGAHRLVATRRERP